MKLSAFSHILKILLLVIALSACDLPRSGPSHNRVMVAEGTKQQPTGIVILEVNSTVIATANVAPPMKIDKAFLNQGNFAADHIAAGDTLAVTVFENVETPLLGNPGQRVFSLPALAVDQRGNIFLPYAGELHVAGLSLAGLREKIRAALADQTPDPQVVVDRTPGNAATVSMLGTVVKQGLLPLEPQVSQLTTAIAAAGGSMVDTADTVVTVVRQNHSAELRLDDLMLSQDREISLRPGDRVILREDKRTISVFGAAGSQGALKFSGGAFTLTDALAGAGGLNSARAYPKGVFVYRMVGAAPNPTETVYHFDMSKVQGAFYASQFVMRNKDVLYVSEAPFANFSRVLDAIRGTASAGENLSSIGN